MRDAAGGDTLAFRQLYERYKKPIMSYLFQMLGSTALAEEALQETFLKVYRARAEFNGEAKFSTWLWTIARNTALDCLRKKKEFATEHWEELADTHGTGAEELPDAEAQLIARASQQQLDAALQKLPPAQREALSLRVFSDLSYEEISATLQVPVSSVKNYIHRAKAALARALQTGGTDGR